MSVKYRVEQSILIVTGFGKWDLSMGDQAAKNAASFVHTESLEGTLLDLRDVEEVFTVIDVYRSTSYLLDTFPIGTKHAIVHAAELATDEKLGEKARFFETVALNRGMPAKVFFNYDDALAWLLS